MLPDQPEKVYRVRYGRKGDGFPGVVGDLVGRAGDRAVGGRNRQDMVTGLCVSDAVLTYCRSS